MDNINYNTVAEVFSPFANEDNFKINFKNKKSNGGHQCHFCRIQTATCKSNTENNLAFFTFLSQITWILVLCALQGKPTEFKKERCSS
jgi:hypothetical protein